jgi:hypothetical protein
MKIKFHTKLFYTHHRLNKKENPDFIDGKIKASRIRKFTLRTIAFPKKKR